MEQHILELPFRVNLRLVVEVPRRRISTDAAREQALRLEPRAELHDGDETVAARAVDSFCLRPRLRTRDPNRAVNGFSGRCRRIPSDL